MDDVELGSSEDDDDRKPADARHPPLRPLKLCLVRYMSQIQMFIAEFFVNNFIYSSSNLASSSRQTLDDGRLAWPVLGDQNASDALCGMIFVLIFMVQAFLIWPWPCIRGRPGFMLL